MRLLIRAEKSSPQKIPDAIFELREAAEKCAELRKMVHSGINPSQAKKAEKASASGADSFEAIAREWFGRKRSP